MIGTAHIVNKYLTVSLIKAIHQVDHVAAIVSMCTAYIYGVRVTADVSGRHSCMMLPSPVVGGMHQD